MLSASWPLIIYQKHNTTHVPQLAEMAANTPFFTDAYYSQITANEEVAFQFLQDRNILRNVQNPPGKVILLIYYPQDWKERFHQMLPECPRVGCRRPMTWVRLSRNRRMNYAWRCPRHLSVKRSHRRGSMFEQSNLSCIQIIG